MTRWISCDNVMIYESISGGSLGNRSTSAHLHGDAARNDDAVVDIQGGSLRDRKRPFVQAKNMPGQLRVSPVRYGSTGAAAGTDTTGTGRDAAAASHASPPFL